MIKIAPSPIHGRGVFATQEIKAGTKILELNGHKLGTAQGHQRNTLAIYGQRYRLTCEVRWLNHSDRPSVIFKGTTLVALRDIPAGEELLLNYGSMTA